jgi:hypothetical protein
MSRYLSFGRESPLLADSERDPRDFREELQDHPLGVRLFLACTQWF